jgi:hypothetical protein
LIPDYAEPVIGRRFAPTRWLHPGYARFSFGEPCGLGAGIGGATIPCRFPAGACYQQGHAGTNEVKKPNHFNIEVGGRKQVPI